MRVAEVELNQRVTFLANDKEHKAFKLACVENNTEMGTVLREMQRRYVREQRESKRELSKAGQ